MTALGNALRKAGIDPLETKFNVFLTEWIAGGRTLERLIELARARYDELPSEGPATHSPQGHVAYADARPPFDGAGGPLRSAQQGQPAPSSPPSIPKRVPKEPTPVQKAATAAVVRRLSLFDTFKISDGRTLHHVWSDEWEQLRSRGLREGWLFDQLMKHCKPAVPTRTSECVTEEVLQRMIQKSAEMSDAAA